MFFVSVLFKTPRTADEWRQVALGFETRWNYPHCLGGLDGKHVRIVPPARSGSTFYNFKGFHSIVLMALVDSSYEFVYVGVGSEGRAADGGIWNACSLYHSIADGSVKLPEPAKLPGTDILAPFTIVADDAFRMNVNLIKPFSRRGLDDKETIFNYRLSRARRVSENAFGIMVNRFRCMLGALHMLTSSAEQVVLAIVTLHNFLRRKSRPYLGPGSTDQEDAAMNIIPGEWRQGGRLQEMTPAACRNASNAAKAVRLIFADYFVSPQGAVPWQNKVL